MSIETEKWVMRPGEGIIRHADTGMAVQMLVPERLKACVVLPEALALLTQMLERDDNSTGVLTYEERSSTEDILRRAGVMK